MGKATIKPIVQLFKKLGIKFWFQPVLIEVIVKVIVVSKANVIKNATSIPKYFLSTFKA